MMRGGACGGPVCLQHAHDCCVAVHLGHLQCKAAQCVGVCAMREQQLHGLRCADDGGPSQGPVMLRMDVCPLPDQDLHDVCPPMCSGCKQRCVEGGLVFG
eukprot:CAMPEP_0202888798 /NCGR_PEP_ID=MMETSP1391-20130828/43377_1 /ASSEMBLY_ACC=CAM_ASM_000867 /TAXON_ID=1034604 /ORGANISM="Chlamydomonas leiostraca, Strain SAG 11-49" /LENGTH=99 /DNA_ID=CAMNT_0049572111 /DNA_START=52 /DNA_END=351 /DNA_ORIENTATION=+